MSVKMGLTCLRTAKSCYESESHLETYVAAAFGVVGLFVLYRQYGALSRIFKGPEGDDGGN